MAEHHRRAIAAKCTHIRRRLFGDGHRNPKAPISNLQRLFVGALTADRADIGEGRLIAALHTGQGVEYSSGTVAPETAR
jgi:hypothetical protein